MKSSLLNYVFSNKWVSTPIIQTNSDINDVFTISCILQPSLAWKPGLVDTDTIETKNRISLLVNSSSEVHEFILTKLIFIISGSTDFFCFLLKLLSRLLFNASTIAGSDLSFDNITAQHYDPVCPAKASFTSSKNNSISFLQSSNRNHHRDQDLKRRDSTNYF